MRIADVHVHKVVVPMKPDTVNTAEFDDPVLTTFDQLPKFIVRIESDGGMIGLGESGRGENDRDFNAAATALRGADPLQINWRDLPIPHNSAYDTFEMAILDLVGKALGVPVHQLLGGACRDRVLVDYWTGRRDPSSTAHIAERGRELGFEGIKLKCKLEDPTAERVRAIHDTLPDMPVVLDPNERFHNPPGALKVARQLQGCNVVCFESPVPQWNLDWYVALRDKMDIPLALHLGEERSVLNAIKRNACDYMNLGGGMFKFVQMADMAHAAGIPVWHGSGVDLGIRDMSYVHACASAPACTLASDIIGNLLREDDLVVTGIGYQDGHALVPQTPGLGVELDEEALTRYLAGTTPGG